MNQEILNKLHTALYAISPLASDRERIIAEMGETIWLESLEKMIVSLPGDDRTEVIEAINNADIDRAISIFETNNVDVDTIITEVATSVMDEVLTVSK